jgi:hypothetical protein
MQAASALCSHSTGCEIAEDPAGAGSERASPRLLPAVAASPVLRSNGPERYPSAQLILGVRVLLVTLVTVASCALERGFGAIRTAERLPGTRAFHPRSEDPDAFALAAADLHGASAGIRTQGSSGVATAVRTGAIGEFAGWAVRAHGIVLEERRSLHMSTAHGEP